MSLMVLLAGCAPSTGLIKADGNGFAQSEIHKLTQTPEKVTHYQPISLQELTPLLPASMQNKLKPLDKSKPPFTVDQEQAHLVTFSQAQHQLQLTYMEDSGSRPPENFFIVRMTETKENPLAGLKPPATQLDSFGNIVRVEPLSNDSLLYHRILTTNSTYVYKYYTYDDKNQAVQLTVTTAHEIEFYDQGIWYHLAYQTGSNHLDTPLHDQMVALAKELIAAP